MVEDELIQQFSFVRKLNCVIRNLKSKIKGVNYTNLKVLCRQNVPNSFPFCTRNYRRADLHGSAKDWDWLWKMSLPSCLQLRKTLLLILQNGQRDIEFQGSRVRNKYDVQLGIYRSKITVSCCKLNNYDIASTFGGANTCK